MGRNGIVASGHALASQAGIQTLMAGGNAVDAAIATAAALGVVEPAGSGVGGDGFILIYWAETGEVSAVNATGPAPGAATRERYLADGGIPMKGIKSVSVPGLVDGWLMAHERYGALSLEKVFRPAISLCEEGFPVSHLLAEQLQGEHGRFAADPHTRAVFTKDGGPIPTGSLLCNRNLGTTLRKIAQDGRKILYEGEVARAIAEFSRARDGLLTEEDLGNYHAHWAEPIHVNYRGYEVYEMPPNSSGHILLQELNIVELFDLQSMGCNTAESIHMMVEAKKLAFADRESTWLTRNGSIFQWRGCSPNHMLLSRPSASTWRGLPLMSRQAGRRRTKTQRASVRRIGRETWSVYCRVSNPVSVRA